MERTGPRSGQGVGGGAGRLVASHRAGRRGPEQPAPGDPQEAGGVPVRLLQVLFELFQNADDAAAQLAEMLAHAGPLDEDVRTSVQRSRRFRVEAKVGGWGTLRVTHWGRGINQHHVGGAFRAGRERGYDLDLRNMLALHYSEKDEGATGRFGLGFKSVFLLTDAPRVTGPRPLLRGGAGILPVHRPVERAARAAGVRPGHRRPSSCRYERKEMRPGRASGSAAFGGLLPCLRARSVTSSSSLAKQP